MQSWVHCRIYHKRCQGLLHSRRDGYQHLHLGLDGKGSGGAGYDCGVHDVMGCVGVMYGDGDQHLHFGLDGKGSGGAGYDCGVQKSHQERSVPQTPHRGVSSKFLLLAIASLLTLQTHSPPTAEEPSGEVSAPEPTGDSIVVLRPPLPSVLLRLLSTR